MSFSDDVCVSEKRSSSARDCPCNLICSPRERNVCRRQMKAAFPPLNIWIPSSLPPPPAKVHDCLPTLSVPSRQSSERHIRREQHCQEATPLVPDLRPSRSTEKIQHFRLHWWCGGGSRLVLCPQFWRICTNRALHALNPTCTDSVCAVRSPSS